MAAPQRRPRGAAPLKNPARRPTCWVWRTTADSVPSGATERPPRASSSRRAHGSAAARRPPPGGSCAWSRSSARGSSSPPPRPGSPSTARPRAPALTAWLTLICALLVRVEFEVGEGCTRPGAARPRPPCSCCCRPARCRSPSAWATSPRSCPDVVRGRLAPAPAAHGRGRLLVLARAGGHRRRGRAAVATGPRRASPSPCSRPRRSSRSTSSSRACASASAPAIAIRSLLRPFAWVWLVDLLLMPIGVLVADRRASTAPARRRRAAARRAARRVRPRAHRPDRQRHGAAARRAGRRRTGWSRSSRTRRT